jgi:peroxiredoxin
VIALVAIAYVTLNTVRHPGPGSRGPTPGKPLPPFAVPLALSRIDKDANIAARAARGAGGSRPACEVRGRDVLNVCDLARDAPLVLAFFVTRGGEQCRRELDLMQAVGARYAGVRFAAVSIRGDRSALRRLVRAHRWSFPVGYDRDGAVANLYGVAVCPTVTFAYPGRVVMATSLGFLDAGRLAAALGRLVSGARARGWRPPRT